MKPKLPFRLALALGLLGMAELAPLAADAQVVIVDGRRHPRRWHRRYAPVVVAPPPPVYYMPVPPPPPPPVVVLPPPARLLYAAASAAPLAPRMAKGLLIQVTTWQCDYVTT